MIREKKTHKQASSNKAFLIVILLSFCMIILSTIVGYFENKYGIKHLQIIIYIIVIIAAYILIKKYITEYRYSFFDNEVIIEKLLGNKVDAVASIRVHEIDLFSKASTTKLSDKSIKIIKCDISKKDIYVIKYKHNDEDVALFFNPSQEFVEQLQKAVDTKHYDEIQEDKIIK